MNLRDLSDEALLARTETAAQDERAATTRLLHHLREIERRGLYARAGCASLFDYCVRVLKMSEPQAARRVNASRALAEFPEIEASINNGTLSLTAVSQAQSFFRREARSPRPLGREDKKEILAKLENQSTRQVEKVLLAHSSEPRGAINEKVRPVSDALTEVRVTLDEDTMEDLQRLQEIWSHELPGTSLSQLIKKMAQMVRRQVDPVLKAERAMGRAADATPAPELEPGLAPVPALDAESTLESKTGRKQKGASETMSVPMRKGDLALKRRSRYIPASVRHQVWQRDRGACTYFDPLTGRRCGSRHFLQIDHIHAFARGGSHSVDNLRLRCFEHNRLHARETFGEVVN